MTAEKPEVCPHGHLKRSCQICELQAELAAEREAHANWLLAHQKEVDDAHRARMKAEEELRQEREAHAETKQTLRDYTHPTVAVDTVQNLEDALSRERAKRKELARQLFRIEQTEIAQTIKQIDNTIEENRSLMNMVRQERAARERAEIARDGYKASYDYARDTLKSALGQDLPSVGIEYMARKLVERAAQAEARREELEKRSMEYPRVKCDECPNEEGCSPGWACEKAYP